MSPPIGSLPAAWLLALAEAGKPWRRSWEKQILGSGGEFGFGPLHPRCLGAFKESAGSELGSQASLGLGFESVPQAHVPHLGGKQCDSLTGWLVGRSYL